MVQKILHTISQKVSGLHQAAYLLAFFTFLSQILGLVRDRLLAGSFGAGATIDVYYAAFRIPDLVLIVAASIVSISILVPLLTTELEKGTRKAKVFIDTVFSAFFIFIVGISVVLFFLLPSLLPLLFPGFDSVQNADVLLLTRILLLSPILLGTSNLFASIVQVQKRFFVYALSPVLYNLGIIVGIVILYPRFGIAGLGAGVILGALAHLGIQVPAVKEAGLAPVIRTRLAWKTLRRVIAPSIPRSLTLGITNIAVFFLLSLASRMPEGSISVFTFSFNLQSVPLALIGVSYSLAAFPTLSRLHAEGKIESFVKSVGVSLRHIIFWSLPAMVLFIVLRAQIVRTILGTGAFDWDATRLTAAALALFVVGVVAQGAVLLFTRGYYAAGNTYKPLITNVVSAGLIVGLAYFLRDMFITDNGFVAFLEGALRVSDVAGTEVLVLPFAFMIGMIVNSVLLWMLFVRDFGIVRQHINKTFVQVLAGAIIMAFSVRVTLSLVENSFNRDTLVGIFGQGVIAGLVGIGVFIGVLRMLKNPEIEEIWKALRKKLWRVEVVGEEAREL